MFDATVSAFLLSRFSVNCRVVEASKAAAACYHQIVVAFFSPPTTVSQCSAKLVTKVMQFGSLVTRTNSSLTAEYAKLDFEVAESDYYFSRVSEPMCTEYDPKRKFIRKWRDYCAENYFSSEPSSHVDHLCHLAKGNT